MTITSTTVRIGLPALLFAVLMAGCNTTAGVGRDVSSAGRAVTDSAEENKGY